MQHVIQIYKKKKKIIGLSRGPSKVAKDFLVSLSMESDFIPWIEESKDCENPSKVK